MTAPWTPDIDFDDALAARLIATQWPDLAGLPLEPFGEGWDNRAYLVGGRWVARFPRRRKGIQYLEGELAVLPQIAGRLPLPIPAPSHVGRRTPEYDAPFAAYPLLRGTTLDAADLDDAARHALAAPLGRFLAALHALAPPSEAPIGKPEWASVDVRRARIDACIDEMPADQAARLTRVANAVAARLPADAGAVAAAQRTLVHGDIYARHLLIEDGQLSGIIDWGDVHLGDAALDLGAAWLCLPPEAHAKFRAAYGDHDDAIWERARFRAVWDLAITLHFCHATHDPLMLRAGLKALDWLDASV